MLYEMPTPLQAFSHWSWEFSHRQLMIVDIQVRSKLSRIVFTSVSFHPLSTACMHASVHCNSALCLYASALSIIIILCWSLY
jgi:hypothetical protein